MALRILLKTWDSGQAEFQLRLFSELALLLTIVVHIGQEKSKLSAGFSLHDRDPMFMYILKDISTAFQLRTCYYAPIDFKKRGHSSAVWTQNDQVLWCPRKVTCSVNGNSVVRTAQDGLVTWGPEEGCPKDVDLNLNLLKYCQRKRHLAIQAE